MSATINAVKAEITEDFELAVKSLIADAEQIRQAVEDDRANHRNHNRLYLMFVAFSMTLIVPTVLPMLGYAFLLRYATSMAIVPDLGLTCWAWIKKY
jgi:hypothetical protein